LIHFIYVIAHLYPVAAIPAALGAVQLAFHFKRQKRRPPMVFLFMFALFCVLTTAVWIFFRGDLHAQHWVKMVVESFSFSSHD
jgi:4-hydroxybenzoate polyprenyltransferase